MALLPASPAWAAQTTEWTTAPPATASLGSHVSFQWRGTANDSFGARITGCFANFPDGNNFWTYFGGTFGGNYTGGNCYYNNRYLGTPGNYPITVGFFLNNGSTMSITQNVQVIAPTPGVYTSGDVVKTATSVERSPCDILGVRLRQLLRLLRRRVLADSRAPPSRWATRS